MELMSGRIREPDEVEFMVTDTDRGLEHSVVIPRSTWVIWTGTQAMKSFTNGMASVIRERAQRQDWDKEFGIEA